MKWMVKAMFYFTLSIFVLNLVLLALKVATPTVDDKAKMERNMRLLSAGSSVLFISMSVTMVLVLVLITFTPFGRAGTFVVSLFT